MTDQTSAGLVALSARRHGPQPVAPIASPDSFAGVMALIALIGDAGAAKKRLAELMDAQKAAAAKIEEASKAEQRLAEIDAELAKRRAAHDGLLVAERQAQDAQWKQRHDQMVSMERQAEMKLAAAEQARKEAADLRELWQTKTAQLRAALGAAA
jgi:hypothetical protein